MNKTNFLTVCVVILVLLNGATLFYLFRQKQTGNNTPAEPKGPGAFIIETLKLDEKQQDNFASLRKEHQQAVRTARAEDKRLHDIFFGFIKQGKPFGPEADSVISMIAVQRRIMETATYVHFYKLRALCNEKQQKLFDEIADQLVRRIGQSAPPPPRGNGRPPGPRPPDGEGPPPGAHDEPPPPGEKPE